MNNTNLKKKNNARKYAGLLLVLLTMLACNLPGSKQAPPPVYSPAVVTTAVPLTDHIIRAQYYTVDKMDPASEESIPGVMFSIFDNRNNTIDPQMAFTLWWDNQNDNPNDDVKLTFSPAPTENKFYGTLERLKEAKIILDDGTVVALFEDTGSFLLYKE